MTYADPPTLPLLPLPPPNYPRPKRKMWPWVAGISGILAAGLIVTLVLVLNGNGSGNIPRASGVHFDSTPKPISRADLMAKYAQIAPLDTSATPDTIDLLAQQSCSLLDNGKSTDLLISAGTSIYGASATQVMQLMVSYKCPKYLKDFK
jgi:hypothetical protein